MTTHVDRDGDWRVEFIRPAFPGDGRCIMLYGREGEIVGPLTMEIAEAWMDHFDNARYQQMLWRRESLAASRMAGAGR